MNIVLREPWSVERFLEWEDRQERRHEFDGTRIIEMTGGSRAHQRIVDNLIRFFEDHLDLARFDAVREMRLAFGGKVRYPDLALVAGPVPDTMKTLHDALILFEVLSAETSEIDLTDKKTEYASVPSIRRYILVEQDRVGVSVLERVSDGWRESQLWDGNVEKPKIGLSLPLSAIYRRAARA